MTVLEQWHELIDSKGPEGLNDLLADDVVFLSPVVHSPQKGKALTKMYLSAAFHLLSNDSFKYVRELSDDSQAVLEFEAVIDDITVNGVDMMRWNEEGKITEFKVMLRPLQAIHLMHEKMKQLLGG